MGVKSKLYTFFNRIVTIKEDTSKGIIKYDTDNLLPQNILRYISESGTATSCIEALNQYIFADGFVDEELGKALINDKQTFNQLLSELVPYVSNFQGVAIHVLRDTSGSIVKLKVIPFECVRKSLSGEYVYNPTYSLTEKYDEKKDVVYPAFRGVKIDAATITEHIEKYGTDKGEILYHFKRKPGQYHYPLQTFFSAISDIETDAELSKYELESVNNSYLPSGILALVGDIDDENEDDEGKTEWGRYEETLEGFTGNQKDAKGESGRQKLAVFHAKTKEEIPVYTPISNEGILNASDQATKRVAEKVARAFGVPPFIIGLGGNVSFATNIISDNITLFNNRVKVLQGIISEALSMCFPEKDFTITQLNPVRYIAPEVYAKLTDTEIRDLAGYKTEETKTQSTISLAQTLGVGSTTSLFEVIKDPNLSPEVKLNSLILVFNIPEENAKKLISTNVVLPVNNWIRV